jgi:hypothetical protein
MADLASLLKDPNFTNANDATKQAIFDKFAPQDSNFSGANSETQLAIRSKFGLAAAPSLSGIPLGRTGASQIPTEPGANLAPTVAAPQTLGQKIMGYVETPFAVGANLATGPITYLAGAGGPEFQRKVAEQIQYQPRTQQAQAALEGLGSAAEASKIPPFMPAMGLTQSLGPATRAARDLTRDVVGAALPFGETTASQAARLGQERIAQSVQNSAKIEAAQSANKLGIALNPAVSNPTKANKLRSLVAGNQDINAKLAEANSTKWTELVKKDIGIEPNQVLDAKSIEAALEKHSTPYNIVRQIPVLAPDAAVVDSIKGLVQKPTIGGESVANAINGLVEDAVNQVSVGRSGADVVRDIRQLRRDANNTYRSQNSGGVPSPEAIAQADTRIKIANALERLIDVNVSEPKLLDEIRKARAAQAKIYDVERATNFATNKVDPQVFAKMVEDGKTLSGVPAEIGKIAANFPEIASVGGVPKDLQPRLTRTGIGGTLGALAGLTVGQPYAGAAIGAGAGALTSSIAAKRIGTPAYQAAQAIPQDFRPVNALRPVEPNLTPNALVPYDYSQSVITPSQIPNFQFGRPEAQVTTGMGPQGAPQLAAPAAGGPMAGFRAEEARAGAMSRTLGQQAEAKAAAAEAAAPRVPTSGGIELMFDPVTNKLVPAQKGMPGATLETIEGTGKSAVSAANKALIGQFFDMTAAEKVAWSKSLLEGMPVAQGQTIFGKLSPEQIATKMADRQFAQQAIDKAREKALAFDDIVQRSKNAQIIREATANRERMLDVADLMEEQLSRPRPVSSGVQGAKTRAAQRNALVPERYNEGTNLNNMTSGRP